MALKNDFPKVSVVIPTFNSQDFIGSALESIFKQDYPREKIEVLVVDSEATTDDTRKIAKRYPVEVLNNPKKLAEPAKTLGYKNSTGELFFYLDSDAQLVSRKWLREMTKPFIDDPEIVGATTKYKVNLKDNAFNRYMSQSELQLPPILEFILPSFKDVTVEKRHGYDVLNINPKKSPPMGMCLYRKKILDKVITDPDTFNYVDIAIPIQLAELGYNKFAYVPSAGFYHRRNSLYRELRRQKRDVTVTYLPVVGVRKFQYIDFKNPFDIAKIILWIVYVNLIFPSLIVGIYKTIKYKDLAGMYELPVNFLLTNYIIFLFLTDRNGRELLKGILFGKPVSKLRTQMPEEIFYVDKTPEKLK